MTLAILEPAPSPFLSPTLGNAVAGSAGFGLVALNHQNKKRAERRTPAPGAFVDAGGARLHYVEKGAGPPVVLIHGNGTMLQDWQLAGIFDTLAAYHRVVAVDRPGFGYSTRPRSRFWTARAQADAVAEALGKLGIEDACIVGHSFASTVAIALALDHPHVVSRLILASGFYYPNPRVDALMSVTQALPLIGDLINHTVAPLIGKTIRPLVDPQMFAPAAVPSRWIEEFPIDLAMRPSQLRATSADSAMIIAATMGLSARYGELKLPIIVIAGQGDRIVGPAGQSERFHAAVKHSKLLLVPDGGHMVHHTHASVLLRAVEQNPGSGIARAA